MSALTMIEEEAPEAAAAPLPAGPIAPPEPAPAPVQPVAVKIVPLVALALAVVASFLSVVGLTVANRTVVGASLIVADARERQEQLARVGRLIDEAEALRLREAAALERIERARSGAAATVDDVRRAMDDLKQDLARREDRDGAFGLVRDGQSELAERIGQLSVKLERIEHSLSASRRANPATGRAPTS
jgi:hypothetical protein